MSHGADEARADSQLLHLLTCPICRDEAIGHLLECRRPAEAEGEAKIDYSATFKALEERSPELIELALRRRGAAEDLLAELLARPHRQRPRKLRAARFRNSDLLDLLLETSQARLLTDPGLAEELAGLAVQLTGLLAEKDGDEGMATALCQARCLQVGSRRLRGDLSGAEAFLGQQPALNPDLPIDRAVYCRTIGLLRWEQGRRDEAATLLRQASLLYAVEGFLPEKCACLALLGLFHAEQGETTEALSLFLEGWRGMDRGREASLALRAGLGLADCLADAGQEEKALALLREVWKLYREADAAEMIRVYWLEARVLARLGATDEARHLLESVLARLSEEGSPAELALAALDLALVLGESGLTDEIGRLTDRLNSLPTHRRALATARNGLADFSELARLSRPQMRDAVRLHLAHSVRAFRASGLWIKPLPFT